MVLGSKTKTQFYFFGNWFSHSFAFLSRKLHKNYQMSDKIDSHICLMLSAYKSFHQTVKYDRQKAIYYKI